MTATRLVVALVAAASLAGRTAGPLTIEIEDYAAMPITGLLGGTGQTDGMLARVNALREEPGDGGHERRAARLFLADLNGPLYIIDKSSRKLTTYLDFNGREGHTGLFRKYAYETGYANGLVTLEFDPDYRRNGKFYTVHLEDPALTGSSVPDAAHTPGLKANGFQPTAAVPTPGSIQREAILVEWTDTNVRNATFEGTAREVLRVPFNTRIHPMGALSFNPTARRGDADWRVMYIGCGDGGAGESRTNIRLNPQRLDTLVGKILRIIPDPAEHTSTSVVSENGRYRIPNDNPFVATPGARKEIWAWGFRNPHRLHWAIDRSDPRNNRLIADSIGLHTWETVNIVHKGANYGYSYREGNQALLPDNRIAALPDPDTIPVHISDTVKNGTIAPTYPVIQYGHVPDGGDAIGAGFLYRGRKLPALEGKYIFTDISTGKIWYADYKEMLAADDGNPQTMAERRAVKIVWKKEMYDSMFPIAETAYHERGGQDPNLPGRSLVSGEGRADAQLAVDAAGELYVLTKTDGFIRSVVAAR